jgi:hypothetical protein
MVAAVGSSERTDAYLAGKDAAEQAAGGLSQARPTVAFVFGSSWFNHTQLLQGVRSVVAHAPLIGGSTAGELLPHGPLSGSCAVMLVSAEALAASVGLGEGLDRTPREAGRSAAASAMHSFPGERRVVFLVISDGLVGGHAEAARGMEEVLGISSLIVGGMAGDDGRFMQTTQYANHHAVTRAVAGALLGGDIKVGVGIAHGFAPISKPRRISRSRGTILYELDGQPAASVYADYLGHEELSRLRAEGPARGGIAYPLGVQPDGAQERLLRNVVSFGEDGSLLCSSEVPTNAWVQLMIGNKERTLEAAREAARQAMQPLGRVGCAIVFDSAMRRTVLGRDHAAREIAVLREVLGATTPFIGCYTYGEQAPWGGGASERTAIHTGSVLVITLGT